MQDKPIKANRAPLWPLYGLILAMPLGVAGQHILSTICLGYLALYLPSAPASSKKLLVPLVLGVSYMGWLFVANLLNHTSPFHWKDPLGYSVWVLMPWLVSKGYRSLSPREWQRVYGVGVAVMALWGVIVWSQFLFGWRVSGIEWVRDLPRPRGLYSHPLTLAYSALLFWPLAGIRFLKKPKDFKNLIFFLGVLSILLLSQSRMVQLVSLLLFVGYLCWKASRMQRLWGSFGVLLLLLGFLFIPNPFSERFLTPFQKEVSDRESDYADDRVAFWLAYSEIIKERPLIGHGPVLDRAYRTPYYEAVGLGQLEKKYEAHNVYLQVLAEGGVLLLGLFLAWFGWLLMGSRWVPSPYNEVIFLTLLGIALAGLTQNFFQDIEVRHGLGLLWSGWALLLAPKALDEKGRDGKTAGL